MEDTEAGKALINGSNREKFVNMFFSDSVISATDALEALYVVEADDTSMLEYLRSLGVHEDDIQTALDFAITPVEERDSKRESWKSALMNAESKIAETFNVKPTEITACKKSRNDAFFGDNLKRALEDLL